MLINKKQHLTRQLKQLGDPRPFRAIEQDIRSRKQDIIYKDKRRSDRCQNATIAESRSFCRDLTVLEVELEVSKDARPRIIQVREELDRVEQALGAINLRKVSQRDDPFARSFGDPDKINLMFNLFLAILIEVTTVAGMPVVMILIRAGNRIRYEAGLQNRLQTLQQSPNVTIKEKTSNKQKSSSQPSESLAVFLRDCLSEDEESFVGSTELRNRYQHWCEENTIKPVLNATQIGETMVHLGYQRTRRYVEHDKKRLTGYMGLSFKSD